MSDTTSASRPLDIAEGLSRVGGERDFYRELLELFLEDVPPRLDDLRAAIAAQDPGRLARIAHSIKGAAANLSAAAVRDCAFRLEMQGRAGAVSGLEPLVAQLAAELERLGHVVKTL